MCGRPNVASGAVTTTGGAGAASGSTTVNCFAGWLHSVEFDYHASAPGGTTDVALTQAATPTAILTVANNATDGVYYPRAGAHTIAAGAAITNSYVPIWIHGPVTVTVSQCDALTDAVTVYITTHSAGGDR
jgi:hypothetical protein